MCGVITRQRRGSSVLDYSASCQLWVYRKMEEVAVCGEGGRERRGAEVTGPLVLHPTWCAASSTVNCCSMSSFCMCWCVGPRLYSLCLCTFLGQVCTFGFVTHLFSHELNHELVGGVAQGNMCRITPPSILTKGSATQIVTEPTTFVQDFQVKSRHYNTLGNTFLL